MKEELLNLVYVFPVLLPMFLAGSMARFARRGKPDGWRVTAVVWLVALVLSRNGSELFGIAAWFVTGFPVGAAVCGIGLRLRHGDK